VTPGKNLRRRIASSEALLRGAIKQWDAVDLARGQQCCTLLNSAIEELEAAKAIAERHSLPGAAALAIQINEIRSEAKGMIRIVDASTAFCRGMAARIGAGESACAEPFGNLTSVSTQG
jgi:hypothetical protein